MKAKSLFFGSQSNHWSTADVFLQWLTFLMFTRSRLISSRGCLLIGPISGFKEKIYVYEQLTCERLAERK